MIWGEKATVSSKATTVKKRFVFADVLPFWQVLLLLCYITRSTFFLLCTLKTWAFFASGAKLTLRRLYPSFYAYGMNLLDIEVNTPQRHSL